MENGGVEKIPAASKFGKPEIRMAALIDHPDSFLRSFSRGDVSTIKKYFLTQQAARLSQADHFENLICLNTLKGVKQYAYQVETVRKAMRSYRGRVLLADEVGLGKTIEAGMVLKEYLMRGMVKRALILTPPALLGQWCEELAVKFQIKAVSTDSAQLRENPEQFWKSNDLIVASLALARNKRHRPSLRRIGFDLVIVDEAHHVKNSKTAGWKLINELKSRFLLLLSATPVENNLMDLFSLITLLKPGQLGTRASFKRQFVLRGDPTQPRNREELRERMGEVMIRNTRALADIKLPPRHAVTVLVEGEPAERELYSRLTDLVRKGFQNNMNRLSLGLLLQEAGSSPGAVRKTLLKLSSHAQVPADLKVEMGKLARLCDYVPNTGKTARLLELLSVSREKVLVFSRFIATLEDLGQRLSEAGVGFCTFKGNMAASQKDQAVLNFQNGCNVMLCSEIGGEGRNLQFCSTMVNYDLPWNPMKIEQRIGRIHRIGQTRPVHVYNLCADNTAEHHILEVLDKRINLFELVIGEVDLVLGQRKSEMEFEDRILDIYGRSRNDRDIADAFETLGDELLAARTQYDKVKKLDGEIFANDYEI
ncbi:MAG: DEAD/DEAH box helicase [Deltaproteobacteria bacterium]|nr:DEAD/DEAH box helicase [Deltaproteobacteria bacterium]